MKIDPKKQEFFKLLSITGPDSPRERIYVYYRSRPLYSPAYFDRDRYYFGLPLDLREKMIAGELIADFNYLEWPMDGVLSMRARTPCSILLSDRYD